MKILNLIIIVLGFLKSLEFIYIWQIKEYRFDRFFSYLKEEGVLRALYATQPRIGAKSPRNLLVILLNTLLFLALSLVTAQNVSSIVFSLILLILTPFLALCVTFITVFMTGILASIKRESLVQKALRKVEKSNTQFIGITGSFGKTTTKEYLYHIISQKYKVAKTEKTVNTDVGIALSILKNLKQDTEYFIAEVGAYKRGEIAKICRIISPKYAILTGIGNQHLSLFGSIENLVLAKKELLEGLKIDGKAYVNEDIVQYQMITKDIIAGITSFSIGKKSAITAGSVKVKNSTTSATVFYKGNTLHVEFSLLGQHNLSNLLPCIALAIDLGLPVEMIEKGIKTLEPVPNKLSIHKGPQASAVISDASNSSVDGFLAAIDAIKSFDQKKKIVVSKGIIELGDEKRPSYGRILESLRKNSVQLYTTDKLFDELNEGASVAYFRDEQAILKKLLGEINDETSVLIEGRFTPKFINELISRPINLED